jgi:hypothetical protein
VAQEKRSPIRKGRLGKVGKGRPLNPTEGPKQTAVRLDAELWNRAVRVLKPRGLTLHVTMLAALAAELDRLEADPDYRPVPPAAR